ncbi:MAG: hypothetical protein ABEK02_02190 [Haloquadratum sp.]
MALRLLALAFGIGELLAPRALVDAWMRLATTDDGDVRSWVYTAARIEGVLLVLWALSRSKSTASDAEGY